MTVDPTGKFSRSPFGVKTKTSSLKRSSFTVRRNSSGSDRWCCHSSIWRSHAKRWSLSWAPSRSRRLVAPVRGDPVLRDPVHLAGADLDLDAFAVGTDHRRVQRLVAVGLRHRDVVLEAPGDGPPARVHDPERFVALAHGVGQDAEGDDVVDLIVEQVLRLHLLVDREEVLRPAVHLGAVETGFDQLALEDRQDLPDVALALRLLLRDVALQLVVHLRVQEA